MAIWRYNHPHPHPSLATSSLSLPPSCLPPLPYPSYARYQLPPIHAVQEAGGGLQRDRIDLFSPAACCMRCESTTRSVQSLWNFPLAPSPPPRHGFHLSSGISLSLYLLLQATSMDLIFVKFAYLLSTYVLATSFLRTTHPPGHEESICSWEHDDADKYKHSI